MNTSHKTNWRAWYMGVLGFLVLQIILYHFFTQAFS